MNYINYPYRIHEALKRNREYDEHENERFLEILDKAYFSVRNRIPNNLSEDKKSELIDKLNELENVFLNND